MNTERVITWAAVAPRESSGGFVGSVDVVTQAGVVRFTRLSAASFARCIAVLRGNAETLLDREHETLLGGADLQVWENAAEHDTAAS